MAVARLSLTDFRSYADAVVAPGSGFAILTGENGAGKTNVLEAVSLLSPGRGLRGASLGEMARRGGAGGFAVAARLALPLEGGGLSGGGLLTEAEQAESPARPNPSPSRGGASEVDIGTGNVPDAPERRQVRINGAPASANSLAEWLSVLWITPAMDRLFADAAAGRRRFLDRLVLALRPDHAGHTARYEAAMRARNKLLAEAPPWDEAWLAALEARMAEHGAAISEARAATAAALGERLEAAAEGPFARAALALEGGQAGDLAAARARDAAAGRTLAGPHRADLAVTHLGKNQPAALSSTGEQKALLIGLILAHADLVAARAGRRPILLLDEIAAHLDPSRRAALFERLGDAGGQVWMTGTEPGLFAETGAGASWFEVANGRVTAR
ncbi:MAG TPA: DNA replication/repair protein RecF [Allosphingosinicella sp.]|nr:DNA replication/repair protein RecF [Allosphingosinicella sp.]